MIAAAANSMAVATLLGLAAYSLESVLRGSGWQTRWVWAGAMLGSLILPVAAWQGWMVHPGLLPWSGWGLLWGDWLAPASLPHPAASAATVSALAGPAASAESSSIMVPLLSNHVLLVIWLLSSATVSLLILASVWRIRRARAHWRPAVVDGVPVLVSTMLGPAALGVLRGAIVMPAWALALEERSRRLILLHEEEHLRAGDPRLLFAGLLALVLMPWNPALWWQFRRLRQALELDCDARVLRQLPDARSYGLLLLEVGRRRGGSALAVTALAEPRSFLERRIRMMSKVSYKTGRVRLFGGAGLAAVLVFLACEAQGPAALESDVPESSALEKRRIRATELLTVVGNRVEPTCSPVLLLDGELVESRGGGGLAQLDPAEIELVEVVKGAAAPKRLAAYPGVDASCGVIMVTSKTGLMPEPAGDMIGATPRTTRLHVELNDTRDRVLIEGENVRFEGDRVPFIVGEGMALRWEKSRD